MGRLPAAKRREQLLEVAADLFATSGYARTTTAQLAKAAGVTEPIIYRHFASKKDLFVALIQRTGTLTLDSWRGHLAEADDPAERLRVLLGDNPMVSGEGRKLYRVFLQAITEIEEEDVRSALDVHIKELHRFIVVEIDRAEEAGALRLPFSAEIIAWVMIDVALGYGVLSAMQVPGHSRDSAGLHVRQLLAKILTGKTIPPPPAS